MSWTGSESQRREQGGCSAGEPSAEQINRMMADATQHGNGHQRREHFDIVAAMARLRELDAERSKLKRQIKDYRRNGDYGAYLRSEHWQALRQQFCGPGSTCCGCGCDAELTLHHMSYERLYGETTGDLIRLCNRCHNKLHEWLKTKYPGKSISSLAQRTKQDFHKIFGRPWSDDFDLKLPGRRVVKSIAQKIGRRKARATLREKEKRHDRHDGIQQPRQPIKMICRVCMKPKRPTQIVAGTDTCTRCMNQQRAFSQ